MPSGTAITASSYHIGDVSDMKRLEEFTRAWEMSTENIESLHSRKFENGATEMQRNPLTPLNVLKHKKERERTPIIDFSNSKDKVMFKSGSSFPEHGWQLQHRLIGYGNVKKLLVRLTWARPLF